MSPSNTEIIQDTSGELDLPAESYRLRYGADVDWIGVHKVYERDESVKETTNPKSHSHIHNSKNTGSNSQRFSGNLKPGIIGLPGNIQNSSILGHSARRPSCVRIIPQKVCWTILFKFLSSRDSLLCIRILLLTLSHRL